MPAKTAITFLSGRPFTVSTVVGVEDEVVQLDSVIDIVGLGNSVSSVEVILFKYLENAELFDPLATDEVGTEETTFVLIEAV